MENKICIVDIDGVLNYYPNCWIDFVNKTLNRCFDDLNDVKNTLSYNNYKKLKEEYRTSGYKETLPVRAEAKEMLQGLRELGYTIIIISARPVVKYPSLYKQTINWLQNNFLIYDNIMFSEFKQYEIIKHYPHADFIIEDNKLISTILSNLGYNVLLLNSDYNQGKTNDKVTRIKNLKEALEYASK